MSGRSRADFYCIFPTLILASSAEPASPNVSATMTLPDAFASPLSYVADSSPAHISTFVRLYDFPTTVQHRGS